MPTATIDISRDSYCDSFTPTVNLDGPNVKCGVQDISFNSHRYRPILYCNLLAAIPVGSTISSAKIQANVASVGGSSGSYTLLIEKVIGPNNWVEDQVTWDNRHAITEWEAAGIDVGLTEVDVGFWPTSGGAYEFTGLEAISQDALNSESGHFCVRLKRDSELSNVRWFDMSDRLTGGGNNPKLVVVYTLPLVSFRRRPLLGGSQLGFRPALRRPTRDRLGGVLIRAA